MIADETLFHNLFPKTRLKKELNEWKERVYYTQLLNLKPNVNGVGKGISNKLNLNRNDYDLLVQNRKLKQ